VGKTRITYKLFVGSLDVKKPLRKLRLNTAMGK
jgi:hypothetical protein